MTTKELLIAATMIAIGIATPRPAEALPRTWVGGNANWDDGGSIGFWNPADEPDADDEAIFDTPNAVSLGSSNSIWALTMSAGIDLGTAGHDLTVDGLIQLVNASTILDIGGGTSTVQGDSVTINSGGVIRMTGGDLRVTEESGDALLDLNTGGTLSGYGSVHLDDAPAGVATLLTNDGTITASHPSAVLFGDPPVDKLAFTIADSNGRFDLDGSAGGGVLNVQRNQTLEFNGTVGDPFSGLVNLFQNATLDISSPWTVDSGSIVADNGSIDNVSPIPDVPAGNSTIAGGALTLEGGTINVTDVDGVLQFDAPLVMNSGTLSNSGLVIFNANATVAAAADFNPVTAGASFTVAAGRTVVINQTIFNFDGPEAGTSQITVSAGGTLTLNVTDYDSDAATNSFGGVVTLNNGVISVTSGSAEFVMDGVLNSSASGSDQSLWTGEALDIGNDAGSLDADVNISGSQPTQFGAQVDFNSDADLNVANGATAHFLAVVNFNSVNGGNNAEFTGSGELVFSAGVNFSETTHLNMAGGTVDLDGAGSVGDTINIDAPLTINAELMHWFGKTNGGGGTNLLDVNNSVNTGAGKRRPNGNHRGDVGGCVASIARLRADDQLR